ncbi:DNA-3-methyladenine glycosylase 1 [Methyloligella halotolerans]|uniref:DNA-3-methyladenine glycosylase I n=1 Tax=Methyloligella halotolerans TaxID=1177755 RepID=A0A1E2RYI3_9HYPH|nr:DNA-3-methyladenine glycosylase I [Methyloligella halotolerans]ODA67297.1 DNA-3-methyladenine glycosylase 1 [Methyloligella halotolerans]
MRTEEIPADGTRCGWAGSDPLYIAYHDNEWGVPQHDARALFEKLVLEGFQAGLSWITILRKRERFREVFENFDPEKVARFGPDKVDALVADPGIIRHRGKIEAAIGNAQAFLELDGKEGFSQFIWSFVDGAPIQNRFRSLSEVPAETAESRALSKALKARGFRFCGPTTLYAMMQSMGLVNDHMVSCPRHAACEELAKPTP